MEETIKLETLQNLPPAGAPVPAVNMKSAQDRFAQLLPSKTVDLTAEERAKIKLHQEAQLVLGVAASAIMTCAAAECPVALTCPLQQIHKAPMGELCPLESNYVIERFAGWMLELDKTEASMNESDRSSIAQLVTIDLQERRCVQIMSLGKAASMTDQSVKEIDLDTGKALSYETIVHANQQIIQELRTARRMLLDDMERTEKAKTRKLKTHQAIFGKDLSTRQSANADKIRNVLEGEIVTPSLPVSPTS